MISKNLEKIRTRSLDKNVYLDELPLNWYELNINLIYRRVEKKSFCIIKREHLINSYPEE